MDREAVAGRGGLFRAYFGGREGTVAAAFQNIASSAEVSQQVDTHLSLRYSCFDLPSSEGKGSWRFLSPADGIFVVLTDCEYYAVRQEHVVAEGLLEFHLLLEGPVELSLPQERDATATSDVSLIVCQQAAGMAYDVVCQPGRYRMASFYVRPALLRDSFGMDTGQSMVRQLLSPGEETVAMTEQKIDPEFLRRLRDLFEIGFTARRDLPLAAARVIELLVLAVEALHRVGSAEEQSIVFTARELTMFDRARQILANDFSESLTIPRLARRLGTNATKLKSGFRLLYGTTIFAYRNRHRMDRAMELLAKDETSIAVVAYAVGFRHQASFTSAFRAHFGMTPKQARHRLASSGAS